MTLEDAVKVLNKHCYETLTAHQWKAGSHDAFLVGEYGGLGIRDMPAFTAIAIAEKLEREVESEARHHMPATRKLMGHLKSVFDETTCNGYPIHPDSKWFLNTRGETLRLHEINAAIAEWKDNVSTTPRLKAGACPISKGDRH